MWVRIFNAKTMLILGSLIVAGWSYSQALAQTYNQPNIQDSQVSSSQFSVKQLQQAADAGDPDAQYALGFMYYYGKNVTQDLKQATILIKKAAVQGQPQAVKALNIIEQAQKGGTTTTTPAATTTNSPPATTTATNMAAAATTPITNASTAAAPVAAAPGAAPVVDANQPNGTAVAANTADATTPANAAAGATPAATSDDLDAQQQKLLQTPSHYYTIQLLAGSKMEDMVGFRDHYQLQNNAFYYHTIRNGKDWYVLVYGLYPTRREARTALEQLPSEIRQQGAWIKSLAKVHESILKKSA